MPFQTYNCPLDDYLPGIYKTYVIMQLFVFHSFLLLICDSLPKCLPGRAALSGHSTNARRMILAAHKGVAQVCDIIPPWYAWEQNRKAKSMPGAEGATNHSAAAPAVATLLALLV